MKPHQAQYKKGEVDVKSNKDQDAALTVDKTNIAANANVEGKGDFSAKKDGTSEKINVSLFSVISMLFLYFWDYKRFSKTHFKKIFSGQKCQRNRSQCGSK